MAEISSRPQGVNTMKPEQNGQNFIDDIFKCNFFNEKSSVLIQISMVSYWKAWDSSGLSS